MINEIIELPDAEIQRIRLIVEMDDSSDLDAGEWLLTILDAVQRGEDMKYAAKSFLRAMVSIPKTDSLELRVADGV
jgi:hypothetical protein